MGKEQEELQTAGMKQLISSIVNAAAAAQGRESGDYTGEDGLLYCGKCRTPKQCRVPLPWDERDSQGNRIPTTVPCMCQCREQAYNAQKAAEQVAADMKALEQLRRQSLMDERFRCQTFGNFEMTPDNARILKICRRYADNFKEMLEKKQGMLFYGGVGTGKTFAAACIANSLLEKRIPVIMTSFVRLMSSFQSMKEDDQTAIASLNHAKLLIIDDLGAERSTDYALEKVYSIIDSRYRSGLPMILTTNMDVREMQTTADMRYMRIYDRIMEMCYPVSFAGMSRRKAAAKDRYRQMKDLLEGEDE